MATSTASGEASLASVSARATPRSRRDVDTPGPINIVLPKIQVLSSASGSRPCSTQPPSAPSHGFSQSQRASKLTGKEFKTDERLQLVTAAVQDLELRIEPRVGNEQRLTALCMSAEEANSKAETPWRMSVGKTGACRQDDHWKSGSRRERHPRMLTWPALQYKLWVDSSNLSLHRLSSDRRVVANHTRSRRQQQDWTPANNLSLSPIIKSSTERVLESAAGSRRTRHKGGNLNEQAKLVVGSPEKWMVDSSLVGHHVHPRESSSIGDTKRMSPDFVGEELEGNEREMGVPTFPRLPSRLGRNSLGCFLDNAGARLANLQVQPRLKSPAKRPRPTSTAPGVMLRSQESKTQMLRLKGLVRNPTDNYEKQQMKPRRGNDEFNVTGKHTQRQGDSRILKHGVGSSTKQLSFAVPFGSSELKDKVLRADVPLPQARMQLDDTYHIMTYLHLNKIR